MPLGVITGEIENAADRKPYGCIEESRRQCVWDRRSFLRFPRIHEGEHDRVQARQDNRDSPDGVRDPRQSLRLFRYNSGNDKNAGADDNPGGNRGYAQNIKFFSQVFFTVCHLAFSSFPKNVLRSSLWHLNNHPGMQG